MLAGFCQGVCKVFQIWQMMTSVVSVGCAAIVLLLQLGFAESLQRKLSQYIFGSIVTKKRRESTHAHDSPFKIPSKTCACADSRRFFVATDLYLYLPRDIQNMNREPFRASRMCWKKKLGGGGPL